MWGRVQPLEIGEVSGRIDPPSPSPTLPVSGTEVKNLVRVNGVGGRASCSYLFRPGEVVHGTDRIHGEVEDSLMGGSRSRPITAKMIGTRELARFTATEGRVHHLLHNR